MSVEDECRSLGVGYTDESFSDGLEIDETLCVSDEDVDSSLLWAESIMGGESKMEPFDSQIRDAKKKGSFDVFDAAGAPNADSSEIST